MKYIQQDRILLNGMRFYGYHGVIMEEKQLGQWFEIDLEISCNLKKAAKSDNIYDTIDYSRVYELVKSIVEGPSKNLIEVLAGEIAEAVLKIPQVQKILVRVKKPEVPIKGPLVYAAVEIVRCKNDE